MPTEIKRCNICILDIETAPDAAGQAIARRSGITRSTALHRLTAFSVFTAHEQDDGTWANIRLASSSLKDEFDLLLALDAALLDAARDGATIVTYNGTTHDLPVVARRAARHWMFGLHGLGLLGSAPHTDLFQRAVRGRRGKWPTLSELCAGYGIATDHHLQHRDSPAIDSGQRKSQVDVIATFLVLLYELSSERRSEATLVAGWSSLRTYIESDYGDALHLAQFTHSSRLNAANGIN